MVVSGDRDGDMGVDSDGDDGSDLFVVVMWVVLVVKDMMVTKLCG